jgi:hypothetical protein
MNGRVRSRVDADPSFAGTIRWSNPLDNLLVQSCHEARRGGILAAFPMAAGRRRTQAWPAAEVRGGNQAVAAVLPHRPGRSAQ